MATRYQKGRYKEYKILARERESGAIALRSAGSHSPIDIVSIDTDLKIIKLIQSKCSISKKAEERLKEANKDLNGMFYVKFIVE